MSESVGKASFFTEGGASMNTIATGGGVVGIDLARGLGPGRRGGKQHYWRVSSALPATGNGGEPEAASPVWGWCLLTCALTFFVVSLYAMLVSPMVPLTGNAVLDFFHEHPRYRVLFPMLIPTTFVAVLINWMALKFFRHN